MQYNQPPPYQPRQPSYQGHNPYQGGGLPPAPPGNQKPKKKKRSKSLLLRFLSFLFTFGFVAFLIIAGGAAYYVWGVSKDLPDYERLAKYEPEVMTRFHANDGSLIAEYARQRRIYVPAGAIPKRVINAFVSAEDKNFFKHSGIDYTGITKAMIRNVNNYMNKKRLVGASTITQQVAKNFLLNNERKVERKVKEAIIAMRMESAFTKEKILELYLNEIFLGLHSYGVAAASLNYFGKSLDELDVHEVAYLAALPKGPNNYHPFRYQKAAIARRNWVIKEMFENGYITKEEKVASQEKPLGVKLGRITPQIVSATYFAEVARRQISDQFGSKKLLGGGLSVRTTLDRNLQKLARKVLVNGLVSYDRRHGWRGVIKNLELKKDADWGQVIGNETSLDDVAPWRMGVVLNVSKANAIVGLQPKRFRSGSLSSERTKVRLSLKEMKWVRKKLKMTKKGITILGKAPKSVEQILNVGDMIYVAPLADQTKKPEPKNEKEKTAKKEALEDWQLMQVPEVGGGILVMDPHTGRVLALVGGFSFSESQFDRVTQAKRQPGSAFKPFVYAAALDNNYTPSSVVLDAPVAIEQPNGEIWTPKNYGGKFYGPSTLRVGIEKSRNLMTVRLSQDMGMPMIVEYARRFGVYDNLMPVLSMALGAGETTLWRLTTAYAILANGGKQIKASLIDRVQDRFGRTVWSHDERKCETCGQANDPKSFPPHLTDERKQVIDPHTAYQVTSMLEGVVKRGTASTVGKLGLPIAGKTGTTNDERDAWFIGYSPDLVVGVFVGFDTPKPMGKGETGGGVAAPIFKEFMANVYKDKPPVPFRIPPGIQLFAINKVTGVRAEIGVADTIMEAFKPGNEPPDESQRIIDDPEAFVPKTDQQLDSGFY